jgi:hypothetical protein
MKEHPLYEQLAGFFSKPRNAIRVFAIALLAAGTYGTLTRKTDAPAAKTYDVAMTFTTPAGKSTASAQVLAGKQFKVQVDGDGGKAMAAFLLTTEGADSVKLDGNVECANAPAAHPMLVARLGEAATVQAAPGCELSVLVAEAPKPAAN